MSSSKKHFDEKMSATNYGLLARSTIWQIIVLISAFGRVSTRLEAMAMTLLTERPASMFDLPTRLDEDDLLQQYGRLMLAIMNETVSPCEDFYEYACGNWKNAEMVPPRLRNHSFLHAIQNHLEQMLGEFLKNSTEQERKLGTAESKAKMFYNSCVKQSKQMQKGYKTLLEMEEFVGKLETKESANKTVDWITVNFVSNYGVYPLLPLEVDENILSYRYEVFISTPITVLGNTDLVYVKNLTRDFKIESEEKKKVFTDELTRLVEFEKNLTSLVSSRNETEKLRLGEFLIKHKEDTLNWTRYFEVAFNGMAKKEWNIQNTLENTDALTRYLQKTDLETLRTYVRWRTLLKFYYAWRWETADKSVESKCRKQTERFFNDALIPWFIDTAYDADRRADILTVANRIKHTFYKMISKYSWLDNATKYHAKAKLHAMDVQVGYTDDLRHREIMDQIYADINMTNDWFRNLQVVEAKRARVQRKSANKALIPPMMSTRSVNAFYKRYLNLVFIPIGISQFPFYHIKFPSVLKFAGIGQIIGHEIAHGFDACSFMSNYVGSNRNWWSEGSLRNFHERYRCLESQYNKFIIRGVATNGTLTSCDNIADNVGTRLAYFAYMDQYGKKEGDRRPIRGMNFTNKQLFFLKFAQAWCSGQDDTRKLQKMKTNTHASEEFRVAGTLSNMPEFSKVFQCKVGSEMNPLKKCVVW